jgi:hypothetical protein
VEGDQASFSFTLAASEGRCLPLATKAPAAAMLASNVGELPPAPIVTRGGFAGAYEGDVFALGHAAIRAAKSGPDRAFLVSRVSLQPAGAATQDMESIWQEGSEGYAGGRRPPRQAAARAGAPANSEKEHVHRVHRADGAF